MDGKSICITDKKEMDDAYHQTNNASVIDVISDVDADIATESINPAISSNIQVIDRDGDSTNSLSITTVSPAMLAIVTFLASA